MEPWQVEADRIDYDSNTERYVAQGNVLIHQAEKSLSADRVELDLQNMRAYASGNVVLRSKADTMTGTRLEIDLERQIVFIEYATVFLPENNYHISSDKIEKTGENSYRMNDATITTCDGDRPDWRFTGKDVTIEEDGSGTAKHITFYIRSMPMLYSPYMLYPARKDRQTGLLLPQGSTGERKGWSYNQPFFWAISDSTDATFYSDYMTKRGLQLGAEYRYYWGRHSKGIVMLDGLHDEKTDDKIADPSDPYGFDDGDPDYPRPNRDRWWFRMSNNSRLPAEVTSRLELDLISDQDYLREFENSYAGYDDTDDYLNKKFGRFLDDVNDPVRVNRLLLNRIWPTFSLNVDPRYYLDTTRGTNSRTQLSKLPLIAADAQKNRLGQSSFFYNLNTEYSNFWRPKGSRAQRLDLFPRLYRPFRFDNVLTLEPSVGFRETVWSPYGSDEQTGGDDNISHRELFDTRVELFTEIERVFDLNSWIGQRVKHSIRPQIEHEYIPDVDQNDLPDFGPADRIEAVNLLTYSLTNYLTTKSLKHNKQQDRHPRKDARGETVTSPAQFDYRDAGRFKLLQSYDFKKNDQPFSAIRGELDLFPDRYLSLETDAEWSVYSGSFLQFNAAATLWDNRGDRLFMEYRYNHPSSKELNLPGSQNVESLFTELRVKVNERLSLQGRYEYDFEENNKILSGIGFSYDSQCWGLEVDFTDKSNDTNVEFKITLRGIGGIGL